MSQNTDTITPLPSIEKLLESIEVSSHEAPLVHLVKKSPASMTNEELEKYIQDMRELSSSSHSRKAAAGGRAPGTKKASNGIDFSKYLSKGNS